MTTAPTRRTLVGLDLTRASAALDAADPVAARPRALRPARGRHLPGRQLPGRAAGQRPGRGRGRRPAAVGHRPDRVVEQPRLVGRSRPASATPSAALVGAAAGQISVGRHDVGEPVQVLRGGVPDAPGTPRGGQRPGRLPDRPVRAGGSGGARRAGDRALAPGRRARRPARARRRGRAGLAVARRLPHRRALGPAGHHAGHPRRPARCRCGTCATRPASCRSAWTSTTSTSPWAAATSTSTAGRARRPSCTSPPGTRATSTSR